MDLSRREFMLVGTSSVLAMPSDIRTQIEPQIQTGEQAEFEGVADLMGPREARPAPGSGFFEDKVFNGYRYEATDTGDRFFITAPYERWTPLTMNPETQVDEVRVEDYKSFFDHTFARPNAPDDKNWMYTDTDETAVEVTRQGNQGSITTDGQRRWVGYANSGQGNKSGAATTSELEFSLPNNQIVTLAAQGVGGTATLSGSVTWQEFF